MNDKIKNCPHCKHEFIAMVLECPDRECRALRIYVTAVSTEKWVRGRPGNYLSKRKVMCMGCDKKYSPGSNQVRI